MPAAQDNAQKRECPICGGDGVYCYDVPLGHPLFGKAQTCTCRHAAITTSLQQLSGLGECECSKRLEDIDTQAGPGTAAMVSAAREFLADPQAILTIYGSSGNAKTDCLQSIVNAFTAQRIQAVYITMFDLVGWVRAAIREDGNVKDDDAWERLKRLERVRILAIDEFDKVKRRTDWVLDQMIDLLDVRHRFGLEGTVGTVIAMNYGLEGFPPEMLSRFRDGRNRLVHNDDPDLRPLMQR